MQIVTAKQKYMVYSSLKAVKESLPDNAFLKIHKSYIVAVDHITTVSASQVKIAGHLLPISRRSQQALKDYLATVQQHNNNQ